LNKAGQNAPTANLSMGGFAHTNVADATLLTQYPSVKQMQNGFGSWCGTSGGAANAQTLTPTPAITAGTGGQVFTFIAGFSNSAATTMNISGLGAQAVTTRAGAALVGGEIVAGSLYTIINDGASKYRLI
jgi:hypothetical protein